MTVALGVYGGTTNDWPHLSRIARAFNLDYIFGVESRSKIQGYGVPTKDWADLDAFVEHLNYQDLTLVCLETPEKASRTLAEFEHPDDVLYLLGPDNGTLPRELLKYAEHKVTVETPDERPLPISVVGGIVIHDRYVKSRAT